MREIELKHPHRRKHFEFFRTMEQPHFCVCAPVVVQGWVAAIKARRLRLSTSLVYLISRAANDQAAMRWRIRGDGVVEHERVHPSFAVPTDGTDVFSFCEVPYGDDAWGFMQRAEQRMAAMARQPSFEDEPGRDDYLFMSALPWLAFTSVQHPMRISAPDSVPRITWGKVHPVDGQLVMPLAVQVHHALMDGRHVARLYERVEQLARDPLAVLG